MAQVKLEARHRTATGKGVARKLRRDGRVPAVIYGHGEAPVSLDLDGKAVNHLLHEFGHNAIIELTVTGGPGSDTCMIKMFERDLYQKQLVHVDFKRISLKEKIETRVPVNVVNSEKLEKEGGVIELMMQEVEVRALPLELPESVEVDVSGLALGDNLHVKAIKLPNGVELVSDPEGVLLLVHVPRALVEAGAEGAEGAEAAPATATEE